MCFSSFSSSLWWRWCLWLLCCTQWRCSEWKKNSCYYKHTCYWLQCAHIKRQTSVSHKHHLKGVEHHCLRLRVHVALRVKLAVRHPFSCFVLWTLYHSVRHTITPSHFQQKHILNSKLKMITPSLLLCINSFDLIEVVFSEFLVFHRFYTALHIVLQCIVLLMASSIPSISHNSVVLHAKDYRHRPLKTPSFHSNAQCAWHETTKHFTLLDLNNCFSFLVFHA